jgi:hypothetical protein
MGEFKTNAKTREYARKYMREYRKAHPEVVEKNREHSRLFRVRNPTYHHELRIKRNGSVIVETIIVQMVMAFRIGEYGRGTSKLRFPRVLSFITKT